MKTRLLFIVCVLALATNANSQSNPQILKPGITIDRIMNVRNGVIRMERDEINNELYYVLTNGQIYKVIQPTAAAAYDSLVFSVTQHGVQYVQGMVFHDSTWYVSGNNNSNTPLTYGIIVRGKLQPNGSRTWDTLMHTANYQTNGPFDHLFSGVALRPSGDSIYICSGARGDHGEIEERNGLYPGLRNVPMTTNIFALPTHDPNIITLPNDSTLLAASGYVYARGIRNTFDMEFDQNGNLFGVENSGDRDHNEEMNWLQRGHHYGFPWVMGNTDNPQQFPGFDPFADSLINHNSRSWRLGAWTNDTLFPQPDPSLIFDEPILNYGPDCDKYRDSTGGVHDASDEGIAIPTFTAHRSPLGLVFDNENMLGPAYEGDAFMLSWTEGYDSTGSPPFPDSTHIGPFVDPSQDLVHLDLSFDAGAGNFRLNATRIISDFRNPVDAEIDSNTIYVIEYGNDSLAGLYAVHIPVDVLPCLPTVTLDIPTCDTDSNSIGISNFGNLPNIYTLFDAGWNQLITDSGVMSTLFYENLQHGDYYCVILDNGACPLDTIPLTIADDLTLVIDSIHHTTCIGCNDGEVFIHAENGMQPYNFTPLTILLTTGTYIFCVLDANGCQSCDTATVLDDPTGISTINDDNKVSLFPNPVSGVASLSINGHENMSYNIYDERGRRIKSSELNSTLVGQYSIDCRDLSDGTYMLELLNSKGKSYTKFVVIH